MNPWKPLALLLLLPAVLRAQEPLPTIAVEPLPEAAAPASTEASAQASTQLETVVVTAQKREASLQKTPISLQAFDKKKLDSLGIQGLADLASNVPAMTVDPFPTNNSQLRFFIRGVGLIDAQITQDPAVGVYLDGIYIARSAGLALDIADLQRIEVLRGPQGTLYGRNSTGGAINLVSKRPNLNQLSGGLSLSTGERGNRSVKGLVNIPLFGKAGLKLAAISSEREGFVENSGPGAEFGDHRDRGLRAEARWRPFESFTLDYAYDRSAVENVNPYFQPVLRPRTSHGSADLFRAYAETQTVYATHRLPALAASAPYVPASTEVSGHALTLAQELGPVEVKYLGARRTLFDETYSDLGGGAGSQTYRLDTHRYDGPSALMANNGQPTELLLPTVTQEQWSHELQVSGKGLGESLDFIAGAYYFSEEGGEDGSRLHHVLNSVIDPSAQVGATGPAADAIALAAGLTEPSIVSLRTYRYRIANHARALYTQATYTPPFLGKRLHLTAGFRHSRDVRQAVKDQISTTYVEGRQGGVGVARALPASRGNDAFVNVRASNRYRDNSPSFNLQFDLTPEATTYLSLARAYKSGGFNVRDPQISGASGPASNNTNYGFGFTEGFRPEKVQSLEFGVKSEWLGRRLRVNGATYLSQYRDQQINFLIPGTVSDSKTRNAGKSRLQGVELDATVLPVKNLTLSGNYAYLDARTEEVLDLTGNNVANLYPFVSAPRHSFNTAADWTFLKRGWGSLRSYVNYSFVGSRKGSPSLAGFREGARIPSYGLLGAQLNATGIKLGGKNLLDVTLWGKNLLDREYVVVAIDNLPQADRAVVFGEPRSVGLTVGYRYR